MPTKKRASRRGGRIVQGNNRNIAQGKPRGNASRVPQRGPIKPINHFQQETVVDLTPHILTRVPTDQPAQRGTRKSARKVA